MLKNPWVWAAGVGLGLLFVLRGGRSTGDNGQAAILSTNALAASTNVQLSNIATSNLAITDAYLAHKSDNALAAYTTDASVYKSIINGTNQVTLTAMQSKENLAVAKLSYDLGGQTIAASMERAKLDNGLALKLADQNYQINSKLADAAIPLAQINAETQRSIAQTTTAGAQAIASINANAAIRQTQIASDARTTSSSNDMIGGIVKDALPIFASFF